MTLRAAIRGAGVELPEIELIPEADEPPAPAQPPPTPAAPSRPPTPPRATPAPGPRLPAEPTSARPRARALPQPPRPPAQAAAPAPAGPAPPRAAPTAPNAAQESPGPAVERARPRPSAPPLRPEPRAQVPRRAPEPDPFAAHAREAVAVVERGRRRPHAGAPSPPARRRKGRPSQDPYPRGRSRSGRRPSTGTGARGPSDRPPLGGRRLTGRRRLARLIPVGILLAASAALALGVGSAGLRGVSVGEAIIGAGTGGSGVPVDGEYAPTAAALAEIPGDYLEQYVRAGVEMDLDWRFLAAIGAQESDHGRHPSSALVNRSGCVGPMQLGVRGACGDFVGAYGRDGDGDGRVNPRAPEDAIQTAAYGLRVGKGAPATGGEFEQYRLAACRYYGACSTPGSDYARQVMARAVRYGLDPV